MIDDKLLDNYIKLFRGRGDVYGTDSGGCAKLPLNRDTFERHLTGTERIGVYPIVPIDGVPSVVWGCSDFDLGLEKSLYQARQLHDALRAGGVISWIERSRSKGYHVWVFATEPVSAEIMRNMLLAAHQVADVPATEVNPKQTTLKHGQYGNYVRLPYPNYTDDTTHNQRVLNPNDFQSVLHICDFVAMATANRTSPADIARLAAHYKPVIKTTPGIMHTEYDATLDEAMQVLSPLGKVIWRDGPLPSKDRSSTLAKLGYECVKSGLNPSQTKTIIKTADKRWGKYHLRPNGDLEIDKLVIRVHS